MSASRGRQAAMPFILLTLLLDMMSIGIIAPVLPQMVGSFVHTQAEVSLAYGAVQMAFAFMQFFSAPILGALSDQYGRRPVLLLGLFGMAVNFFVTAWAQDFWVLMAVRIFGGAVCSNISVANAYVADITEPENKARNFGLLGAMFGLGFILGPVVGGLLGNEDFRVPFYVAGALTLVNCLYGYFVLPESLPLERRRPFVLTSPFASLGKLRQLKGVEPLLWVLALSMLAQFTLQATWLIYTTFKFGWTPKDNGTSLFVLGIMAAITQGFLMRPMQRWIPVPRIAVWGMVSCTVAFAAWGYASEGWWMYAITCLNLLGFLVIPAIQSMISNSLDPSAQGEGMGAASSITSVAAVIGPLMAGPLMALVSHLPPTDWRVGTPFYVCALVQFAATAVALLYFSRYGERSASASAASV
jgi:DHA1 family tetracycline resistance protein-like MFS transporter